MGDDIIARLLLRVETMGAEKLAAVGAEAETAGSKFSSFGRTGAVALGRFAAGVTLAGVAFTAFSVDQAAKFNETMRLVQNNTGMTATEIDKVRQQTLALGRQGPAALDDIAHGFERAANLGFHNAAAMTVVKAGWEAAIATGGKVADTVNVLGTVMRNFQIPTNQAAQTMGVLLTAAAQGNVRLPDLVDHFSKVGIIASSLHVPLTDAVAAFSALTKGTGDAALAQTYLSNVLMHMTEMAGPARKEAEALAQTTGINLVDAFHKFAEGGMSLHDVLQLTREATKGNTEALSLLFGGMRGGVGAMALLNGHWKDFNTILDDTHHHVIDVHTEFAAMQKDVTAQSKTLTNNVKELGISFGEVVLPAINAVLPQITKFVVQVQTGAQKNQDFKKAGDALRLGMKDLGDTFTTIASALGLYHKNAKDSTDQSTNLAHVATNVLGLALKANAEDFHLQAAGAKMAADAIVSYSEKTVGSFQRMGAATEGFRSAVASMAGAVIGSVVSMAASVVGQIGTMVGTAVSKGTQMALGFDQAARTMATQAVSAVSGMVSTIAGDLSSLASQAFAWGANIGRNFASGISSMVGAVASAAGSILNAAKAALAFLSPNKLGDDPQKWGFNFGSSFAAGLLQSIPGVAAAAQTVLASVKAALGGGTNALSLSGSVTGNTGASVAGANQAGLTALLSALVAEMHQLPPNFQQAGMQVVTSYKEQLAKLYDQMIAKESAEHQKIVEREMAARSKEAEAEATARKREAEQEIAARKASTDQLNHYLIDHNIRDTAENQRALLALQEENKRYAAQRNADIQRLDAARNDKERAAAQAAIKALDTSHAEHVKNLESMLGLKTKEQKQMLEEWLRNHKETLQQHIDKLRATLGEHISGLRQTLTDHLASLKQAEADFDKNQRASFQQHAESIKQALQAAVDPGGFLNTLKQKLEGDYKSAVDKLTYDMLTHSGNIEADTQAAQKALGALNSFDATTQHATDAVTGLSAAAQQAATAMQTFLQQINGSQSLSSLIPTDPGARFAFIGQQLQAQLSEAQNTYAYDLLNNNTAALGADAAAITGLQQQLQQWQQVQQTASQVGVSLTKTFSDLQQAAQTKLQSALDQYSLDLVNHTGDLNADAAAIVAAQATVKQFSDAVQQAQQIATGLTKSFADLQNAAQQQASTALDALALAIYSGSGDVGTLAAQARQAAADANRFAQALQTAQTMITTVTQTFATMQSTVQTAAQTALNNLAQAIWQGSGNIGMLSTQAIGAALNAKNLADALAKAQGIVNAVINPPKPVSPYDAALSQAQLAYDSAVGTYDSAVVTGQSSPIVSALQAVAIDLGTKLKALQDINQGIQNGVSQVNQTLQQSDQTLQNQLDGQINTNATLLRIEELGWAGAEGMDVSSDHGMLGAMQSVSRTILASRG